jgi:hypothetical protein
MLFEKICLNNPLFNEKCREELKKIDKHEIVVKISNILGPCPSHLSCAEKILDDLKFEIARYVLHHEYAQEDDPTSKTLLWFDSKTNPKNETKLSNFINKYLK